MGRVLFSSTAIVAMGMGFAFFSQFILARAMDVGDYGEYNFIYSLAQTIAIFALFGFQNSAIRFIPEYLGQKESAHKILSFRGYSLKFSLIMSLFISVIVFVGLIFFGYAEKYSFIAMVFGVVLTVIIVAMRLNAGILKGFHKSIIAMAFESGFREAAFFLIIGLFALCAVRFDAGLALLLLGAVWFLSVLGSQFFIKRCLNDIQSEDLTASQEDKNHWMSISWPMMLSVFAQRFMRRSDIIILGLMVHPSLVGIYALAAQFADVSGITDKAAHAVFGPRAAKLFYAGEKEPLKALYKKMMLYNALSTLALGSLIALLAPFVLPYFGEVFMQGYSAMVILIIGVVLSMSAGPIQSLMVTTGHERIAMKITIFAAIGNVICNIPAIYYYGLEGAAIVTSAFMVLRAFLSYNAMRKKVIF